MGNTATKEQRPPPLPRPFPGERSYSPQQPSPDTPNHPETRRDGPPPQHQGGRHGRGNRSELSHLLGLSHSNDRDANSAEARRETKAERDARRLERERVNRLRERERSMREENVDGGYLVTQGVYTGIEDYSKPVVRQLMIDRRLAPFWRGLNDHSSSWTEHQLVAVARGHPLPAADEIPATDGAGDSPSNPRESDKPPEQNLNTLTVPASSRAQSINSDSSPGVSPSQPNFSFPISSSPPGSASVLRGRAKTLASLTTTSRNTGQPEMHPREIQLPRNPEVNGQPIEAYLYKDASECPICFLYYPPYLNRTRCCDQPICSECFVQIKRPDPHPPEHSDPNAPPHPDEPPPEAESQLVSEVAACPFCVEPEFGVSYQAPPFRRGLAYAHGSAPAIHGRAGTPHSSSTSLSSLPPGAGQSQSSTQFLSPTATARRRATSLSANAPSVITTDRVRPDWATKLANARAHAARRSAAASALHAAAYVMGNRPGGGADPRFGFGRRGMLRRGTGSGAESPTGGAGSSQAHLNLLALMSDRHGDASGEGPAGEAGMIGPPRASSRRNHIDDVEELMMMEAIRLSLASEEERRKREDKESKKEAKKEAKKRAKEEKKTEKAARKAGLYPPSANESWRTLDSPPAGGSASGSVSGAAGPPSHDQGKGKGVLRAGGDGTDEPPASFGASVPTRGPQAHLERSREQVLAGDLNPPASPAPASTVLAPPHRPSHLRNLSNMSSSASSLSDAAGEPSPGPSSAETHAASDGQRSGGSTDAEPLFNFQSLAAMIDREEKRSHSPVVEHADLAASATPDPPPENTLGVDAGEEAPADSARATVEAATGKQIEASVSGMKPYQSSDVVHG